MKTLWANQRVSLKVKKIANQLILNYLTTKLDLFSTSKRQKMRLLWSSCSRRNSSLHLRSPETNLTKANKPSKEMNTCREDYRWIRTKQKAILSSRPNGCLQTLLFSTFKKKSYSSRLLSAGSQMSMLSMKSLLSQKRVPWSTSAIISRSSQKTIRQFASVTQPVSSKAMLLEWERELM